LLLQKSGLLDTLSCEKKASVLNPGTILLFALGWFAVIYRAIRLNEREMNAGAFFSDIDWTRLDAIVGAFNDRLRWYYLDAAGTLRNNGRQFDHTITAIGCLLIDTLSQFHFGAPSGTRTRFMDFIADYIPGLHAVLPNTIRHQNDPGRGVETVSRYSDALYRGFRCGILHEANISPYGALWSGAAMSDFEPVGLSEYDGTGGLVGACPTIRINAWLLCDSVRTALDDYCNRLLNPAVVYDLLRNNFKDKFKWSFGVDIAAAVL
jgi:hypothetical protein